jgi:hypothetical protein
VTHPERPTPAVRTFFAVALQLGRAFPSLVELTRAVDHCDRSGMRGAARLVADAVLQGARDRGQGPLVRSAIDQQRRTVPLTRLRLSRPGRSPQALAAKRANKVADWVRRHVRDDHLPCGKIRSLRRIVLVTQSSVTLG